MFLFTTESSVMLILRSCSIDRSSFVNFLPSFARRHTLFNEQSGRVKKSGETYKLPKLAETLRVVAKEGADAVYNGSLTSRLVEDIKKAGGIITEDDFANYE